MIARMRRRKLRLDDLCCNGVVVDHLMAEHRVLVPQPALVAPEQVVGDGHCGSRRLADESHRTADEREGGEAAKERATVSHRSASHACKASNRSVPEAVHQSRDPGPAIVDAAVECDPEGMQGGQVLAAADQIGGVRGARGDLVDRRRYAIAGDSHGTFSFNVRWSGLSWCSTTLAARSFCDIVVSMSSQSPISRKKRGPAPTGWGTGVLCRLHDEQLGALDTWIAAQPDPKPSRPEAIRTALKEWLTGLGLLGPSIPEQIAHLEQKIASIPEHDGPSPEAALATMKKAYVENELAKLKNTRTRARRASASKAT